MKQLLTLFIILVSLSNSNAQSRLTKMAFVSFYSELEDVTAENHSGTSQLNPATGSLIFSFSIQSFMFENALMQKHFNEKDIMNSKEFPRAKFIGMITNNVDVNYTLDGEYKVNVKGSMTIKGSTNPIETKAIIKVENGKIYTNATFNLDRFIFGVTGNDGSISQLLKLTVKAEYE